MTMILPATLATASAAALLNIWLAVRVGQARGRSKVWIGDGGDELLTRRMRAQANFVEYAPFVLILLGLLELAKGTSWHAWAYGAAFVIARVLHPFGMDGWKPGRMVGSIVTMLALLLLAVECAWTAYGTTPSHPAITVESVPAA